jgi:branched-chain amino acid transport system substrate-binding protein
MSSPWGWGLAVAAAIAGGYAGWRLVAVVRFRRSVRSRAAAHADEPMTADRLIKRAEAAVAKLREQTQQPRDEILRAQIGDVDDHAAEVLGDLRRYAEQIEALDRSMHEIPVERLRHDLDEARQERDAAADDTLRAELERSVHALDQQLAVADRLDTTRRTLLARIESAVFDLEGLVVRISELIVMHDSAGATDTEARLSELTGDLEGMRAGLTEARGLSESILGSVPEKPPKPETKPVKPVERRKPGRARWDLVTVAVVAVIAVTCLANNYLPHGGNPAASAVPDTTADCAYTFAFLGELTGDNAGDGPGELDGVELAVAQDNVAHAGGCQVRVQQYDTAITGDDAESAATITGDASILAVVGPTYGNEAVDAVPVLQSSGLTVISPSASDSALTTKGWTVFHRTLPSDDDQADAGARYLRDTVKAKHVFVVDDGTDYGVDVATRVSRTLGRSVAGHASSSEDTKDWSPVVAKIKASGADAVYFGGWQEDTATFVKKLRASLPTIPVMSGDKVITETFRKTAGAAGRGTYATCPCVPINAGLDVFRSQFKARYGTTPNYYAPEAYDAARIVLAGLRSGVRTRAAMLEFVNGWDEDGLGRHIRFGPGGGLAVKELNVWAYRSDNGDGYFGPVSAIG